LTKFTAASPIGIFDSGVGGLTVVRQIRALLPNEPLVYFGDTARVPYGTKSQPTIRKYAADDARLLLKYDPKLIVVACNTVSALALDVVKELADNIPVLGVITAGARLAVEQSKIKRIGVIGTSATVNSGAYQSEIYRIEKNAFVFSKACPLFVPLAEEGFATHDATKLIAKEYLTELLEANIDALVLGCTHYPILRGAIRETVGNSVTIIDSAEAIARDIKSTLTEKSLLNSSMPCVPLKLLVSDVPQRFKSIAEVFLGVELPGIELVEV